MSVLSHRLVMTPDCLGDVRKRLGFVDDEALVENTDNNLQRFWGDDILNDEITSRSVVDCKDDDDAWLITSKRTGICDSPKKSTSNGYRRQNGMSNHQNQNSKESNSPPYKRVRALRLFEEPQTPRTLLETSEATSDELKKKFRSRVFTSNGTHRNRLRFKSRVKSDQYETIEANVNPFTPMGMVMKSKAGRLKKNRTYSLNGSFLNTSVEDVVDDKDDEIETECSSLKACLHENNISRYNTEFVEISKIGSGEFGSVFECIHRLDGCVYALKKSRKPLDGTIDERAALNEVYAHAVLGHHPHVVRYYSAWAENNYMLIQNEYCNGGSLADVIEDNQSNCHLTEAELKQILLQVAEGLKYIHSLGLVHMDVKPGNIFICCEEETYRDDCDSSVHKILRERDQVTYKLGDLGHVTSVNNPQVEEGDCRYLPLEILHEDYRHLAQADIFALGLTVWEAASGIPLPKNGEQWQNIRSGDLPYLESYSADFNNLLKQMVHPNPEARPTASALTQHHILVNYANKSKAELTKELNAEKLKNQMLSRKLQEAVSCLNNLPEANITKMKSSRLIGNKTNRSHSTSNF